MSGRRDKVYRLNVIETDIALLPVSGTYVMGADEAIQVARAINPKVAFLCTMEPLLGLRLTPSVSGTNWLGR